MFSREHMVVVVMLPIVAGCAALDSPETDIPQEDCTLYGPIWNASMAEASVLYQDGGASFPVPGGAVWLFGDTFLGRLDAHGKPQYAGAASCTTALWRDNAGTFPPALAYRAASDGKASSPFTYLPEESPEDYRIWPGGGLYLDGKTYVFYELIHITGPGPWGFEGVAPGLARGDEPLGPYTRLKPGGDWRFPIIAHQVIAADGWLYLFQAAEWKGTRGVLMARVQPSDIEQPNAYHFYAGPGPRFTAERSATELLVTNVYGQVSIAWNAYLGKYLMACSSDFSGHDEIRFRVAEHPWGPWGEPVRTVRVPETQGPMQLVYCTYLHPKLFRDDGRTVVLTYCPMLEHGFANPEMLELEWDARPPKTAYEPLP